MGGLGARNGAQRGSHCRRYRSTGALQFRGLECSRGLRHAFGIGTLQSGVPLNITKRWLGHARLSTTAIYADAVGAEEVGFAERFWIGSVSGGLGHGRDSMRPCVSTECRHGNALFNTFD
jgi:hypothetical protein